MECLSGDPVTDFDGRHVRREIGQSGVSQPLESGWRNRLLKISENGTPQKARVDLNLCSRVASTHPGSSMVFVRSVRTPLAIVASGESGCNRDSYPPDSILGASNWRRVRSERTKTEVSGPER